MERSLIAEPMRNQSSSSSDFTSRRPMNWRLTSMTSAHTPRRMSRLVKLIGPMTPMRAPSIMPGAEENESSSSRGRT